MKQQKNPIRTPRELILEYVRKFGNTAKMNGITFEWIVNQMSFD